MRHAIATVVLTSAFAAAPAWAQSEHISYREPNQGGRYSAEAQGVPPGFLPPPGECRVWYDGRPPGYQPRATSCREAERVALRDRNARVVYGGDRGSRYAERRPELRSPGFEQGFRDGRSLGWNDCDDEKRFDSDPSRSLPLGRLRLRATLRRQGRLPGDVSRRLPRRLRRGLPRRDGDASRTRVAHDAPDAPDAPAPGALQGFGRGSSS